MSTDCMHDSICQGLCRFLLSMTEKNCKFRNLLIMFMCLLYRDRLNFTIFIRRTFQEINDFFHDSLTKSTILFWSLLPKLYFSRIRLINLQYCFCDRFTKFAIFFHDFFRSFLTKFVISFFCKCLITFRFFFYHLLESFGTTVSEIFNLFYSQIVENRYLSMTSLTEFMIFYLDNLNNFAIFSATDSRIHFVKFRKRKKESRFLENWKILVESNAVWKSLRGWKYRTVFLLCVIFLFCEWSVLFLIRFHTQSLKVKPH